MPLVQCIGLERIYNKQSKHPVHALRGISLTIHPGEFIAVTGPSGSGKSTLLHLIGLLDRPDCGTLYMNGHDVVALPRRVLPIMRNETVGFVFQRHHLLPALSALQNVMLPLRYRSMSRKQARWEAEQMLSHVGLADRVGHRPGELSGGEQQRVAIARALVTGPALVLADEPTGELDSNTGHGLINFMREANERLQRTFVIVTHDPYVADVCDRVITLQDGLVTADSGRA